MHAGNLARCCSHCVPCCPWYHLAATGWQYLSKAHLCGTSQTRQLWIWRWRCADHRPAPDNSMSALTTACWRTSRVSKHWCCCLVLMLLPAGKQQQACRATAGMPFSKVLGSSSRLPELGKFGHVSQVSQDWQSCKPALNQCSQLTKSHETQGDEEPQGCLPSQVVYLQVQLLTSRYSMTSQALEPLRQAP